MDKKTILSKTAKGVREASGQTSTLAREYRNFLKEVNGKLTIEELQEVLRTDEYKVMEIMAALVEADYVRALDTVRRAPPPPPPPPQPARPAAKPAAKPAQDAGEDLDFTSFVAPSPPPPPPPPDRSAEIAREKAQREAQEKAKQEAAAKAKLEAEARAKQEAAARAKQEAEAKAKQEAVARAKLEAEAKAKQEADTRAKLEAEAKARQEAEQRAKQEAEARAKLAAVAKAKLEAEAKARHEAEQRAKQEAEARAKLEAEMKARQEAEEKARKEAEERVRRETEERVRREMEEKARKEAEEKARREAEEKAKREAEEKARKEAEERARKEEEERIRRETEERVRREMEEKARKEAEERAKKEAEEKARREAEEKARKEAEEKARKEAEEKARKEAEELAKKEAEERARKEAEERARQETEEQARREAEEAQAREEIETARRAAEEAARHEAEERARRQEEERSLREAEEKVRREAEEQARHEAEERAIREAEERVRLAAEEAAAHERQERAPAAAPAPAAVRAARSSSPVGLGKLLTWGAVLLVALVALGFGALQFMSFDGRVAEFEKAASEQFGQPVKIRAVHLSLLPRAFWRLDGVSVGDAGQVKVSQVRAVAGIGTLLGGGLEFEALELDAPVIDAAGAAWLLSGKPQAQRIRVGRIVAKGAKLDLPAGLPPLDAKVELAADGAWRRIVAESSDHGTHFELAPEEGKLRFDLSSGSFAPFGATLQLADFTAAGTLDARGMEVEKFGSRVHGGVVEGKARLSWASGWRLDGDLDAKQIDAGKLVPGLLAGNRLEGKGTFALRAAEAAALFDAPVLQGSLAIRNGSLQGVDFGRMLQGEATTGTTQFSELTGQLVHERGVTQLRDLRLNAGKLTANGSVEAEAGKGVRGRLTVLLRLAGEQRRADVLVGGTPDKIEWRR